MRVKSDIPQFFCNVPGGVFPYFSQVEGRRQLNGSIYVFSEQEILAFVYFSVEGDTFHKWLQRDVHIKDIGCFRLL